MISDSNFDDLGNSLSEDEIKEDPIKKSIFSIASSGKSLLNDFPNVRRNKQKLFSVKIREEKYDELYFNKNDLFFQKNEFENLEMV